MNEDLNALQQEDYLLNVKVKGDEIPEEVYIELGQSEFKLNKENTVNFYYKFKNVQKDLKFRLFAERYHSKYYTLKVLPKPIILNFETTLIYPAYTNKKNETLINTGDLVIPQGTRVVWNFITRDVEWVNIKLSDEDVRLDRGRTNVFKFTKQFLGSENYVITTMNEFVRSKDSLLFSVNVIPDAFPEISAEEYKDSTTENLVYFSGVIKDDYGFKKLCFKYKTIDSDETDNKRNYSIDTLDINGKRTSQEFFYFFDFAKIDLKPGNVVEYFFEVWDNDKVNGSKSARSQKMVFKVPTIEEIDKKNTADRERITEELESSIKEAQLIQMEIDKLNKDLIDKKNLSWPERRRIEDLLDRNKLLQKKVVEINKLNTQKNEKEEKYKKIDEELLEKQKQLEELFESIMSDELKEMFRELEELLNQLDKNKIFEKLEEMKLNTEDIEKQLDRNLELFKQLEFEKELGESLEMLKKLKDEQHALKEETINKEGSDEELKKKQEEKKEDFENIEKKIEKLQEINKDLENKNDIINTKIEQEDIKQKMDESIKSLEGGKNKKAGESQQNAEESMEDMIQKMEDMMSQMYSDAVGEDAEALREILENLIQLSFDQESLMEKLKKISKNDPRFVDVIKDQQKIKDGLQLVEDSLFAVSKRQVSIQPFVNKEISKINFNLDKAVNILLNYQGRNGYENLKSNALSRQQYVMTSINNLALLLDEALQEMMEQMQQMQQMKSGNKKNCSKPKPGGSKSMKSMKSLQQELNRQMEQLRQEMKGGKKKGKTSSGKSMSEELARMAAQQEAIRRMLQEYTDQLKEDGKSGLGNMSKLMKEMEKTEEDLVNKRITNETLKRQQEILTRLLESEKAEREREKEKRRQSEEAKDKEYSNPAKFLEYKRLKKKELELLKKVPPEFNSFYKKKINSYFYNFD